MIMGALLFRSSSCIKASPLGDDERVVALDPAVRGEDEEVEPDCERLAVLGDRLPVELDDVAESLCVDRLVASPSTSRRKAHASITSRVTPAGLTHCLIERERTPR
jgi:hypothetical protein